MKQWLVVLALMLALVTPVHAAQPRLIALGDSVNWAPRVATTLHRDLLAIPAATVADQVLPSVGSNDLVIWLVGANDAQAATDLALYRTMVAAGIRQLQTQGARVVMVSDLQQVYGDAVIGMAGFADLAGGDPATAIPLLFPPIAAQWRQDVLRVEVNAPGCLYLIGDGRPSQWLGCGESAYALAPSGVDQNRAPMNRTLGLADLATGQEIARLVVPPRIVVYFPLTATNSP